MTMLDVGIIERMMLFSNIPLIDGYPYIILSYNNEEYNVPIIYIFNNLNQLKDYIRRTIEIYYDIDIYNDNGILVNRIDYIFLNRRYNIKIAYSDINTNELESIILPKSKNPIMDTFVFCSICNIGLSMTLEENYCIFYIINYDEYFDFSKKINSKLTASEDYNLRIKTLKRWFNDFPGKKNILKASNTGTIFSCIIKQEKLNNIKTIYQNMKFLINTKVYNIRLKNMIGVR